MSDYEPVKKALSSGLDPAMLCQTCPWDRNCITPPTMTSGEVEKRLADAQAKDEEEMKAAQARGEQRMPVASLVTALTFGARDTQAQVCPVFALRLRSGGGRRIADDIRASMQRWDDQS